MSHALVIGGTGMLRNATLSLATEFDVVSVIARTAERLGSLVDDVARNGGMVNPLRLDYRDGEALSRHIADAIERFGEIELVVAWIHSVAPEAHSVIARILDRQSIGCRWFDLLGSAVADPSAGETGARAEFSQWTKLHYRAAVLGFVIEGDRSRWLSDDEISGGTIDAIRSDAPSSVIGQVRPWSMRP